MAEPARASGKAWTWTKRILPPVAVVTVAALVLASGLHENLSLRTLAENREALRGAIEDNYAVALLAYMGLYAGLVSLSIPGIVYLTLTGGLLFGWVVAGAATVVAATAGATVIFLIARTSLGAALEAKAGPRLAKLRAGFQEDALHYLLFLRLVPAFPFWLVNLAPALLGVRLSTYVLGTFVGIVPGTFAFAFVGAGLDSVLAAQRQSHRACLDAHGADAAACDFALDPSALVTPELAIAFAALGVLALVPVIVKKLRRGANAR